MAKKLLVPAACLLFLAHAPGFARDVRLAAADLAVPSDLDALPVVGTARHKLVGQIRPSGNTTLGIGVWRVEKSDRNDPNRAQPMRDRRGRLSGTAGLGFNIGF
jgi:hypothetical protein